MNNNYIFRQRSIVVALTALLSISTTCAYGTILLSSGNFVALGGSAISSTGAAGTVLSNGHVGLFPAAESAITGFGPAIVTNGSIISTGGVTEQATLDFSAVAVGLAGMPSNVNLTSVDLGGTTLFPGVYTFNSDAALNGALTLDANGQNNAFWVFQIGTQFNASLNSSVNIINLGTNGGIDNGIFWNAGSDIIVGENSALLGNYLAGTSITFGSGSSGSARALALAAISLDNNQIDAYGGPAGSDWSGGLKYNGLGQVVAVPEQSTYALLLGISAIGLTLIQRRQTRRS
jgi:hypothetical protein